MVNLQVQMDIGQKLKPHVSEPEKQGGREQNLEGREDIWKMQQVLKFPQFLFLKIH